MEATREQTATALMSLGYKINRNWLFSARGERTPSAYININGHIHDFGSGFHGDFPSFLKEYHNFNGIGEAIRESKRLLGMEINFDFSKFEKSVSVKKEGFIDEKSLLKYFENRKAYFSQYAKLLAGLLPSVSSAVKRKELALKYRIGFQPAAVFKGKSYPERLVMPICDEHNRIVTLWRYNPFLDKKDKLRYVQNRRRIAFNLGELLAFKNDMSKIVLVCEGEKDVLNATANGFRAITSGSATSLFEEKYLEHFRGLTLLVVGDYDSAGQRFNEAMMKQLKPFAKQISPFDWESALTRIGKRQNLIKGFDVTDYLALKNAQ